MPQCDTKEARTFIKYLPFRLLKIPFVLLFVWKTFLVLSRLGWVSRTVSISSHLCMASLLPCLLPCDSKYKRINEESNFTYLRSLCSSFNRFWFLIISSSSSLSSSSSAAFGSKLGSLSISCSSESPLLTAAV